MRKRRRRRRSYSGGGGPRARVTNGYTRAHDWFRASKISRRPLSRQQVSDWKRIAALGDTFGLSLERLGAPYALLRWVAGHVRRDSARTYARFALARAELEACARAGRAFTQRDLQRLVDLEAAERASLR